MERLERRAGEDQPTVGTFKAQDTLRQQVCLMKKPKTGFCVSPVLRSWTFQGPPQSVLNLSEAGQFSENLAVLKIFLEVVLYSLGSFFRTLKRHLRNHH